MDPEGKSNRSSKENEAFQENPHTLGKHSNPESNENNADGNENNDDSGVTKRDLVINTESNNADNMYPERILNRTTTLRKHSNAGTNDNNADRDENYDDNMDFGIEEINSRDASGDANSDDSKEFGKTGETL